MNHSIRLYRATTATWLFFLVAAVYWGLASSAPVAAAICLALTVALVVAQALAFRCENCGARAGLWLLAIWTLLLDFELFVADVILLRSCPKCSTSLTQRKDIRTHV